MAVEINDAKSFKELKETLCNLTFQSQVFDFVNPPKTLRSEKVHNNLPPKFEISDIPVRVYNLNPSIRSTLFNYKQFALK